jgi:DNA-binding transcriptional MerR regulator
LSPKKSRRAAAAKKAETAIPDKLYFKIGEVADLVGVKPYVLRYWETEFPEIAPGKSKTNQRLYKRKEVERILDIRRLLYHEKFTINGARKKLKEVDKGSKEEEKTLQTTLFTTSEDKEFLKKLKKELVSLLEVLRE